MALLRWLFVALAVAVGAGLVVTVIDPLHLRTEPGGLHWLGLLLFAFSLAYLLPVGLGTVALDWAVRRFLPAQAQSVRGLLFLAVAVYPGPRWFVLILLPMLGAAPWLIGVLMVASLTGTTMLFSPSPLRSRATLATAAAGIAAAIGGAYLAMAVGLDFLF